METLGLSDTVYCNNKFYNGCNAYFHFSGPEYEITRTSGDTLRLHNVKRIPASPLSWPVAFVKVLSYCIFILPLIFGAGYLIQRWLNTYVIEKKPANRPPPPPPQTPRPAQLPLANSAVSQATIDLLATHNVDFAYIGNYFFYNQQPIEIQITINGESKQCLFGPVKHKHGAPLSIKAVDDSFYLGILWENTKGTTRYFGYSTDTKYYMGCALPPDMFLILKQAYEVAFMAPPAAAGPQLVVQRQEVALQMHGMTVGARLDF